MGSLPVTSLGSDPIMIIKSAEFVKSAVSPSQYPPETLPEIAFAGRSNVGKSSLINVLVNRKRLVKTSSTPGRTQLINFFRINDRIMFVDIPGYGYAKVPPAVRRQWRPMIETYLTTRKCLRGAVLLMDIRRQPGEKDRTLRDWLDYHGIAVILVLTKADKISKIKRIRQVNLAVDALGVPKTDIILFSAKTRQGREQVLRAIQHLAADPS